MHGKIETSPSPSPNPKARHPRPVPVQIMRPVEKGIPPLREQREAIFKLVRSYVKQLNMVPPVPGEQLEAQAVTLLEGHGYEAEFAEYTGVLINNEMWREQLAAIPYHRRLLLLPKCLRDEERCPAPFDEFGLLCKECGLCSIEDLQGEAEKLGYAVLTAEGSAIVMAILETGKIDAIVGVSCLPVLRRAFPYMESAAVPGMAIPLLQSDCRETNVDMEWVWEAIHLHSDDTSRRMDLDAIRGEVDEYFLPEKLQEICGSADHVCAQHGQRWLAKAGKRWRPFLTVSIARALDNLSEFTELDLQKSAVAVECFHKASLIHDDIEDEDSERYGEKTLHEEIGLAAALNVGDYLIGEGYRLIGEISVAAEIKIKMLQLAAHGHQQLCIGQGEELDWRSDPKAVSDIDLMTLFRQKTSPAFGVALGLGAYIAGCDEQQTDALHKVLNSYADNLGIAYQIRDDLDDFAEDAEGSDMHRDRPSMVLSLTYKRASDEDKQLIERWWQGDESVTAEMLTQLVERSNVLTRIRQLRETYKDQAVQALSEIQNMSVKGLLRRVIGKIFNDLEIKGWCSDFTPTNATDSETRTATAG
ncbi:MAG: polyprenyl synthetase family protein [Planctomycetes bacterium]|nr:polyprenyl synthetase family protein [Planctomycetota bacterium]